ncbi:OsmC family protein [Melioribacteraceae bacterium 4301-Me]|uniref:OsmC family protein n=1 Tax=Pyranulibacter aquaticus TaxID=3163344 RepID=UPI003597FD74
MEQKYTYKTRVDWISGRQGELTVPNFPKIIVATPPEFPKGIPNTWSPEHLFVASINICLMTTFLAIAENSKLEFISYYCEGIGIIEKVENKFMFTKVELYPKIVVKQSKDIERCERIIKKAEEHCLVSNSIKTKIILKTEIKPS